MADYSAQPQPEADVVMDQDLDIPTFLRNQDKKAAVLQRCQERLSGGRDGAEDAMAEFIARINRRLDHDHSTIETVASINDLKRYGLPQGVAKQLEPYVGEQCREDWLVAAFLNKLARHPRYEPMLAGRPRHLIQNYAHRFGVMCVQLEACVHPIVCQCA
jgi:hypothetical protein